MIDLGIDFESLEKKVKEMQESAGSIGGFVGSFDSVDLDSLPNDIKKAMLKVMPGMGEKERKELKESGEKLDSTTRKIISQLLNGNIECL